MTRLIDADKLIEHLNDYALKEAPNDNEGPGERRLSKLVYATIVHCIEAVKEQPTVYELDKVVKQLEEYGTCKDKCSNKSCCYSCKDVVIDRSDAIDIVEAGGKNDD